MEFKEAQQVRGQIFRSLALLLFGILLLNLVGLMVIRHDYYSQRALKNRQVRFRVPAPRGRRGRRVRGRHVQPPDPEVRLERQLHPEVGKDRRRFGDR